MSSLSLDHQIQKLGVISGSTIMKTLAKKGTDTRSSQLAELVAQVCTKELPELNARALDWGIEHEAAARALYEFETDSKVIPVGFIYGKDKRVGCSPDGLIKDAKKGLELKCPFTTRVYIEFLTCGKIKPEYMMQCQFSMWVTGFPVWDFACYDPRMSKNMLHIHTIEQDKATMDRFENEIPEFIKDMDEMLERAGFKFGDQWK